MGGRSWAGGKPQEITNKNNSKTRFRYGKVFSVEVQTEDQERRKYFDNYNFLSHYLRKITKNIWVVQKEHKINGLGRTSQKTRNWKPDSMDIFQRTNI